MPYLWRELSPERRKEWLDYRRLLKRPWHCPPHFDQGAIHYHITGACFEHRPHIGFSDARMKEFCEKLLDTLEEPPAAWCVLPNHYHVLVRCRDVKKTTRELGKLHGRFSLQWNGEEQTRGRQIWHSVTDRGMRDSNHFWATTNYIHHNPVKHGYGEVGRVAVLKLRGFPGRGRPQQAREIWKRYPVLDYGKGWDD